MYCQTYARIVTSVPSSPLKAPLVHHPLSLITARWRVQATLPLSLSLSPILQLECLSKFPIAFHDRQFPTRFPTRFPSDLWDLRFFFFFFNLSSITNPSRADMKLWRETEGGIVRQIICSAERRSRRLERRRPKRLALLSAAGKCVAGDELQIGSDDGVRNSIALRCYPHYNAYSRSWITVTIGASSTGPVHRRFV